MLALYSMDTRYCGSIGLNGREEKKKFHDVFNMFNNFVMHVTVRKYRRTPAEKAIKNFA